MFVFKQLYERMGKYVDLWKSSLLKSIELLLHESNDQEVDKRVRICLSETVDCESLAKVSEDGESLEKRDVVEPTCQLFSRDCLSLKLIEEQIRKCNDVLGRHEEKFRESLRESCRHPKEGIISFYFTKKDVFLTNSTHYIPIQLKRELMEAFD